MSLEMLGGPAMGPAPSGGGFRGHGGGRFWHGLPWWPGYWPQPEYDVFEPFDEPDDGLADEDIERIAAAVAARVRVGADAGFDIAGLQRFLNQIRRATVAQLLGLVNRAITIEQLSIIAANAGELPGAAGRQALLARLGGHASILQQQPKQDAMVVEPGLGPVKQDVMAAAIDLNATAEGAQYEQAHAFDLLSDLAAAASALVEKAKSAVETTISWLPWVIGGAAAVAVIAVGAPVVVPIIVAKIRARGAHP